ncbi:MAG TPA: NUDIX hydrolase N-terminal domain-containing protein [Bacilli bacterium]|nr:NUDIX hydrolase N-terminal domain-containing protein [Bacilli bacterium]
MITNQQLLHWAQQMQAIAQAGLTYSKDPFDVERFEQLRAMSVEMVESLTDVVLEPDEEFARSLLRDAFASEAGYPNPKIDVRGAVFRDGKILMVREAGEWALPGGFADIGLSIYENVAKEVLEEAGFVVKPVKLLAALDLQKHPHPPSLVHCYKFVVRCEILEELGLTENIETDAVDFFAVDELPPLSLSRNTKEQIKLMFAHLRDPDRPTDCE